MATALPIDITIVIATFNSDKLLGRVLDSIREQDFNQDMIETLIVDGGSNDNTLVLAQSYGCTIIPNPETEPVNAKFLGLKTAKGKYLVFLDHDEVIKDKGSLRRKREVFDLEPQVHAVIGSGYINPDPQNIVNEYINEFGDPFSFFMYRLSKGADFFVPSLRKRYRVARETDSYLIVDFNDLSRLPIIELVALGSMIDKDHFLEAHPEVLFDKTRIGHLFYHLVEHYPLIGVTKSDALVHYSAERLSKYLAKIRWRVKNNIYFTSGTGAAGYTGRECFEQGAPGRLKKYLFPLYAFAFFPAFFDAVYLAFTRRKWRYLIHLPLSVYTAGQIVVHRLLHCFGYRPDQRSYDETKRIAPSSEGAVDGQN